jgi:hypothetical protein
METSSIKKRRQNVSRFRRAGLQKVSAAVELNKLTTTQFATTR